MALNVEKELAALERLTVAGLRRQYEEVFGEACRSNHKQWLVKRLIWRLQANEEGGLSERARRRAAELADDADLRLKAPPAKKAAPAAAQGRVVQDGIDGWDPRVPPPGTVLCRPYKGGSVRVTVLPGGFEHEGEVYKSLSAVAKAVTGTHTNGFLFFRLRPEDRR